MNQPLAFTFDNIRKRDGLVLLVAADEPRTGKANPPVAADAIGTEERAASRRILYLDARRVAEMRTQKSCLLSCN